MSLYKSINIGLLTVVFGYAGSKIATAIVGMPQLPAVCKTWNKSHIMEISLFFTGVLLNVFIEKYYPNKCDAETIKQLLRQSSRWTTAAKQDKDPMVRVLHANYGASYLWMLQSLATDSEIKRVTGVDFKRVVAETVKEQDEATRRAAAFCPGFVQSDSFLAAVAGKE